MELDLSRTVVTAFVLVPLLLAVLGLVSILVLCFVPGKDE